MLKIICNKKVELTKEEYSYYLELKNTFGENEFKGTFSADSNGTITSITPSVSQPISMAVIFFLLNLMLNQRLREVDKSLEKIQGFDKRIEKLENMLENQ